MQLDEDTKRQLWLELHHLQSLLRTFAPRDAVRLFERAESRGWDAARRVGLLIALGAESLREDLRQLRTRLRA